MRRHTLILPALVFALFFSVPGAGAREWRLGHWDPGIHNVQNGVYWAFCGHKYVQCESGRQAWRVAGCETGYTYSLWSENGEYKNIFQMGNWERKTYGWHDVGSDPWTASRAAYAYYVDTGRDWSPWDCQP